MTILIIIDTATSKGMATGLFPLMQAPSSIDVDENSFEVSSCEPDPVVSSNKVASVSGAYKTIITRQSPLLGKPTDFT